MHHPVQYIHVFDYGRDIVLKAAYLLPHMDHKIQVVDSTIIYIINYIKLMNVYKRQ